MSFEPPRVFITRRLPESAMQVLDRANVVYDIWAGSSVSDPAIAEVIEEISQQAVMLKLLGSYPKSVLDL